MEDEDRLVKLDFMEKSVQKIAFTNSKKIADKLEKEDGMHIYYPSELADLGIGESIFVLLDA